ncbi:MAG TPA: prepilin-type N-terminal cleavage/methylation domain-containing protein [Phycisphaerae bacterium]|nr:prepilin-type N-terminal cleavage/methylation domain-containing protein [Phycisphaerae bacterium]HRY70299.1 prepilin-type N-terminal cleavage/methylation domain-containing protein [Phycisphaerae bacterium]HSA27530.1 prepilin-type N-terminal cleavage/methylation domain-containing protein [Phycisphaerae bacterium]
MTAKPLCYDRVRGFTLIEILVVVAIIALLIAVLLPSLRNAREQGRAVSCGTRLDQIFKATFMYTQGNGDRLPYYGWRDGRPAGAEWWPTQIAKSLGNQLDAFVCPSDLQPYTVEVVYRRGQISMKKAGDPRAFMLDVTYRGSCDALEYYTGGYRGRLLTSWKRPYLSLLLVEADTNATEPGRECFRFKDDLKYVATPTYIRANPQFRSWLRHGGKTNILFMDGHISRHTPKQVVEMAARQEHFLD